MSLQGVCSFWIILHLSINKAGRDWLNDFRVAQLKNESYNVMIFRNLLKLPPEPLKRPKWESCLITKRNLPSFSQKSGNFLFVIRLLYFLGRNKCNKNIIKKTHHFITSRIVGAASHRTIMKEAHWEWKRITCVPSFFKGGAGVVLIKKVRPIQA